jgi:hypothetical protein
MLGFRRFRNAAIILAGIELMHRISKLGLKDTTVPTAWNAVLSYR